MAKQRTLGIVRNARLRRMTPFRDLGVGCQLTVEAPGSAAPERGEIDLAPYEGRAILAEGEPQELWVYSAVILEEAGLIVTELVQDVLNEAAMPTDPKPQIGV